MDMRVRLPELMAENGMTAYRVAQLSDNRISRSTAYRLLEANGHMEYFEAKMLAALMDIFHVTFDELLTRDDEPGFAPPTRKRRKAG